MAQKLRLTRAVVVQASVYGTDNAVTLDTGRAWVKLSGYWSSAPPWANLAPVARHYIAAAPERGLWGTDWPHTQIADPAAMLDDGRLLGWLFDRAADPTRILVENPAQLYFA